MFFLFSCEGMVCVVRPMHCSLKRIMRNLSVKMETPDSLNLPNRPYSTGEKTVPTILTERHLHHHKLFWAVLQLNSWVPMLMGIMNIVDKFNNQNIKLYPSRSPLVFLNSIKINWSVSFLLCPSPVYIKNKRWNHQNATKSQNLEVNTRAI